MPKRVHEKFTARRSTATRKVAGGESGSEPADLHATGAKHGLPRVRRFDDLPPRERRMLADRGLEPTVRAVHAQPAVSP